MKKLEGNKLVALLISAGMVTTLLAACSINTDELEQGISDLGNAFTSQAVVETEKNTEPEKTTETEATTVETTVETTAEPTPSPTPTATPSPTPLPQRVDFSDYTDVDLSDAFTVTVEDFGEKTYSDDNKELLATFEGSRLVVTKAANKTVGDSINLIVDGFYSEAEGAYSRVIAKAKTEYNLTGVIENPAAVNVDFKYTTNGRTLSVLMEYEVKGSDSDTSTVIDFASFDMLSGQYINLASVSKDPAGLEDALRKALESSLKIKPTPTPTPVAVRAQETTEATEAVEEMEAKNIPSSYDFEAIYFAAGPVTTDAQGSNFATVYGIYGGTVYSAVIDISAYADLFNRYGTSVFFI